MADLFQISIVIFDRLKVCRVRRSNRPESRPPSPLTTSRTVDPVSWQTTNNGFQRKRTGLVQRAVLIVARCAIKI